MEIFERNPDPLEAAAAPKRDGAIVINGQMDADVVQNVASELRAHFDSEGRFIESDFNGYSLGYVTAATREDGLLKAGARPRNMQCYAAGR